LRSSITLQAGSKRTSPSCKFWKEQAAAWLADLGCASVEDIALVRDRWFVIYVRK